jgi:hypothetical protein
MKFIYKMIAKYHAIMERGASNITSSFDHAMAKAMWMNRAGV